LNALTFRVPVDACERYGVFPVKLDAAFGHDMEVGPPRRLSSARRRPSAAKPAEFVQFGTNAEQWRKPAQRKKPAHR